MHVERQDGHEREASEWGWKRKPRDPPQALSSPTERGGHKQRGGQAPKKRTSGVCGNNPHHGRRKRGKPCSWIERNASPQLLARFQISRLLNAESTLTRRPAGTQICAVAYRCPPPLRAPQPRAREKIRDRRRKAKAVRNKTQ